MMFNAKLREIWIHVSNQLTNDTIIKLLTVGTNSQISIKKKSTPDYSRFPQKFVYKAQELKPVDYDYQFILT